MTYLTELTISWLIVNWHCRDFQRCAKTTLKEYWTNTKLRRCVA
jgi:hypothetical protein